MNEDKKQILKDTLLGGFHFIKKFLTNPIAFMKKLPDIPMGEAVLVQASLSLVTGVCMGLVAQSLFTLVWGIFIYPFVSIIVCALTSLIVYYASSYLNKKSYQYQKIYVLVFLASVPAYFIRIAQPVLPSIDLLGLAVSSVLLKIGLTHNFDVPKKTAVKIVLALYSTLFLGMLIQWLAVWSSVSDMGYKISL